MVSKNNNLSLIRYLAILLVFDRKVVSGVLLNIIANTRTKLRFFYLDGAYWIQKIIANVRFGLKTVTLGQLFYPFN